MHVRARPPPLEATCRPPWLGVGVWRRQQEQQYQELDRWPWHEHAGMRRMSQYHVRPRQPLRHLRHRRLRPPPRHRRPPPHGIRARACVVTPPCRCQSGAVGRRRLFHQPLDLKQPPLQKLQNRRWRPCHTPRCRWRLLGPHTRITNHKSMKSRFFCHRPIKVWRGQPGSAQCPSMEQTDALSAATAVAGESDQLNSPQFASNHRLFRRPACSTDSNLP